MAGGMWGAMHDALPNVSQMLQSFLKGRGSTSDLYGADMSFLKENIWPIAQQSLIQHDAYSCDRYGGGLPVPHLNYGTSFKLRVSHFLPSTREKIFGSLL